MEGDSHPFSAPCWVLLIFRPSVFVIAVKVLLLRFLFAAECIDGDVINSVIFMSRLEVPFFLITNKLDSVVAVVDAMHHQNNCLSKCLRNVPLTKYRAMGLMQEFMKLRQNPTMRNTCQKVLYSSVDLG